MAALRHAARRLCDRALLQRGAQARSSFVAEEPRRLLLNGPSPGRRLMSTSSVGGKGIYEQEAAKEVPNVDPEDLEAARKFADIDPEHLKAARRFTKVNLNDVNAKALEVFRRLQESPVDGHKDVTLREVRDTLWALEEMQ